jgi:hypothetical protein
MEEKRRANDGSSDQGMQHERAGEGRAEPVAVNVVAVAELEVRCYDTLLTVSAAE